jgi:hypothetical protein
LGVGDTAAAVEQVVALGAKVRAPATEVGDGIATATVTSPAGSIVGFIDNRQIQAV